MAVDNIALVKRLIDEVWNKGNTALLRELVSDKYIGHEPIIGDVRGLNGLEQVVNSYRTAFPDLTLTIDEIGSSGDRVFVRWTARATHGGTFMGIAPTNKRAEVSGISVDRLERGKIVEHYESYDSLALMQNLGIVPPLDQLTQGGRQTTPQGQRPRA